MWLDNYDRVIFMKTILIPENFFNTKYDASKYPGSGNCNGLENGANCQYFAYEILKYFGIIIPDFRSSDLWEDKIYTEVVEDLEPLDLLFFNADKDSYGAHIGVYVGENKVIHLSKEIGKPIIWDLEEFSKIPRYSCFIGAKRIIKKY